MSRYLFFTCRSFFQFRRYHSFLLIGFEYREDMGLGHDLWLAAVVVWNVVNTYLLINGSTARILRISFRKLFLIRLFKGI